MTETARVALVTGGNRGIGYHVARQLAEAGVHVLLGARDPDRGRAAVAALAADGLDVHLVQLDVTDAASVAAAGAACRRRRHRPVLQPRRHSVPLVAPARGAPRTGGRSRFEGRPT